MKEEIGVLGRGKKCELRQKGRNCVYRGSTENYNKANVRTILEWFIPQNSGNVSQYDEPETVLGTEQKKKKDGSCPLGSYLSSAVVFNSQCTSESPEWRHLGSTPQWLIWSRWSPYTSII